MLTKPLRDLLHTIAEYNRVYKQPIKFSRLMANTRWSTIEVLNRVRLLIAYGFVIAEDSEGRFKDTFMVTGKGKEFLGIRELLVCAYG